MNKKEIYIKKEKKRERERGRERDRKKERERESDNIPSLYMIEVVLWRGGDEQQERY